MSRVISKPLSRNDLGLTGAHQAGMVIPKGFAHFFPKLNRNMKNPRRKIKIICGDNEWILNFIYYNNKFFGGTRNEYRLTGMTRFFREMGLEENDRIEFNLISLNTLDPSEYRVTIQKSNQSNDKKRIVKSKNRVISWEIEV